MKAQGLFSPMWLAGWSGIGSLLVSGTFLLGFLFAPGSQLGRILFLTPACAGCAITTLAQARLRKGVSGNIWADDAIEPLRKLLEYPVWTYLSVTAFCVSIALIVWGFNHPILFISVVFPLQTFMSLSTAMRPKIDYDAQGMRIDWAKSAPIRSEHWGQTRRDEPVR